VLVVFLLVIPYTLASVCTGWYTSGTVPPHIGTIVIQPVRKIM